MNKKGLFAIVAFLTIAMVVTSLMGPAEALGRGRDWRPYKADAILGKPVITYIDDSGAPFHIILEGYRPTTSVIECIIEIDGVEYSYPEDFTYEEVFHMEMNAVSGEADLTATTTYTFINLPSKPTLSEDIVAKQSPTSYDGGFVLSGTKMFHILAGGGSDQAYYEGEEPDKVLVVSRTGFIIGWPSNLR